MRRCSLYLVINDTILSEARDSGTLNMTKGLRLVAPIEAMWMRYQRVLEEWSCRVFNRHICGPIAKQYHSTASC